MARRLSARLYARLSRRARWWLGTRILAALLILVAALRAIDGEWYGALWAFMVGALFLLSRSLERGAHGEGWWRGYEAGLAEGWATEPDDITHALERSRTILRDEPWEPWTHHPKERR